jgi:hypothetical protein
MIAGYDKRERVLGLYQPAFGRQTQVPGEEIAVPNNAATAYQLAHSSPAAFLRRCFTSAEIL